MDPICKEFEKKLSFTFWPAFLAGVLQKATTCVGSGAVAWATIVLMGGFASNLSISDFATITLLVLLIIFLLALAVLTSKLVTKKSLPTGSYHPLQLMYSDKRLTIINVIKVISSMVQCPIFIWSFRISLSNLQKQHVNSVIRYVLSKPQVDTLASLEACLQSCTIQHFTAVSALESCAQFCFPAQNSASVNLLVCLFTFYFLMSATCSLGLLCIIIRIAELCRFCWLRYSSGLKTLSLTRYHDEVLSRALNIGLVEADEFDTTAFLLRGLGEDLVVRNIPPLEVKRRNEDFVKYLFYHPKGVEIIMGMLASEDTLLQQTAANLPGFWSSESELMKKKGMLLLSRLAEKLGMPGRVAEGAANSFKSLAIAWENEKPSPLLHVYVSRSGAGRVGGGKSTNAVSRSETRGGAGSGRSSESAGGGKTRETGSVSGDSVGGAPAAGETSGGEGSGNSNTSVRQGRGEGSGESSSAVSFITGGQVGRSGKCEAGETSGGEGSGNSNTSVGQGRGEGSGESSSAVSFITGGQVGRSGNEQPRWNVVHKMVDLVANTRLPTVLVYVRALDSFFMSESVRTWLATEEKELYDAIKIKLEKIIQGSSNQDTTDQRHKGIPIDARNKPHTRLLAFSAWERLQPDSDEASREAIRKVLKTLDPHLNPPLPQPNQPFVIWFDEVTRYQNLCEKYDVPPGGLDVTDWPPSEMWDVKDPLE